MITKDGKILNAGDMIDMSPHWNTWFVDSGPMGGDVVMSTSDAREAMIEFARKHVKAALKAAAENAIAKERQEDYGTGEIWVDKKSVLDSYPENLIT